MHVALAQKGGNVLMLRYILVFLATLSHTGAVKLLKNQKQIFEGK
jgi:hypothetical protein